MEVLFSIFLIYILPFAIASFILFYVMKAAVSSALEDRDAKRKKEYQKGKEKEDLDELIKLRDMELLSDEELEEVIEIYTAEKAAAETREQYLRCLKILNELKEREYFTDEQFADRSSRLKEHLNNDWKGGYVNDDQKS